MLRAINAASSAIAVWRCASPSSSHNATAGAGHSARSKRNCTTRLLLASLIAIFAPGQDDTLKQPVEHAPRRQQILKRPQRPRRRRLRQALQVRPPGRDQRAAAVGQHEQQIQRAATAHPAHHRELMALQWVTRTHDPHHRREPIKVAVGSMSGLPLRRSRMTG